MKLFCFLFVFLGGCVAAQSPHDPIQRTLGGAAIGAASGAAIGAATGDPGKGAAIGSVVGAVAGALTSRPPSYQRDRGEHPRYDEDMENQCDSLYHEEEREACQRGVQRSESGNARRVRSDCNRLGNSYGEAGSAVPIEVADRYDKDVYKNACLDGLREGHASGWKQRLRRIESNAARRSRY